MGLRVLIVLFLVLLDGARAPGPPGPPGTSIVADGTWNSGTAYVVDDVVFLQSTGQSYGCILGNTNELPPNPTYWVLLADHGVIGSTGATGATGPPAAQHFAVVSYTSQGTTNVYTLPATVSALHVLLVGGGGGGGGGNGAGGGSSAG